MNKIQKSEDNLQVNIQLSFCFSLCVYVFRQEKHKYFLLFISNQGKMFALSRSLRCAEVWKIALDTPLYQALGCGNKTRFMVKEGNHMFSEPSKFLHHVKKIKESLKHENDICLEAACRRLAVRKTSTSSATGYEGRRTSPPITKKNTTSEPPITKKNTTSEPPITKKNTTSEPPITKKNTTSESPNGNVLYTIDSDELKLELINTKNGDLPCLTYINSEARPAITTATGTTEIKTLLRKLSPKLETGNLSIEASKLIRLVGIYIPDVPRPNYTMRGAFSIMSRKHHQGTEGDVAVPVVDEQQADLTMKLFKKNLGVRYITGSDVERKKLFVITHTREHEVQQRNRSKYAADTRVPFKYFKKDKPFLVKNDVNDYSIKFRRAKFSLTEFILITDSKGYDMFTFVRDARSLYAEICVGTK